MVRHHVAQLIARAINAKLKLNEPVCDTYDEGYRDGLEVARAIARDYIPAKKR